MVAGLSVLSVALGSLSGPVLPRCCLLCLVGLGSHFQSSLRLFKALVSSHSPDLNWWIGLAVCVMCWGGGGPAKETWGTWGIARPAGPRQPQPP